MYTHNALFKVKSEKINTCAFHSYILPKRAIVLNDILQNDPTRCLFVGKSTFYGMYSFSKVDPHMLGWLNHTRAT